MVGTFYIQLFIMQFHLIQMRNDGTLIQFISDIRFIEGNKQLPIFINLKEPYIILKCVPIKSYFSFIYTKKLYDITGDAFRKFYQSLSNLAFMNMKLTNYSWVYYNKQLVVPIPHYYSIRWNACVLHYNDRFAKMEVILFDFLQQI
jgi:hypothetical protein